MGKMNENDCDSSIWNGHVKFDWPTIRHAKRALTLLVPQKKGLKCKKRASIKKSVGSAQSYAHLKIAINDKKWSKFQMPLNFALNRPILTINLNLKLFSSILIAFLWNNCWNLEELAIG